MMMKGSRIIINPSWQRTVKLAESCVIPKNLVRCLRTHCNSKKATDRLLKNYKVVCYKPVIHPCFYSGSGSNPSGSELSTSYDDRAGLIIRKLLAYVWPKDNKAIRVRVVSAMGLLVGAKVVNVTVPFLFKEAIDHFNQLSGHAIGFDTPVSSVFTAGGALIIGYGVARAGQSLFRELQNAVFARVAQHSMRTIARNVFLHLHNLDMTFHLNRQTGALAKAIDRGTKGIDQVLRFLVFNIVPTTLEVSMVTGIMWYHCGSHFAAVTIGCVSCYTLLTWLLTRWRTVIRKEMNQADNMASNRAIDSLINYETVKYFNNEKFEADNYDRILAQYETASLKTSESLAILNFGQNAIITSALAALMLMVAQGIQTGAMTVGDMVMVNGLLFQISVPLGFLGSTMREIKLGLVDMRTMFDLMEQKSAITSKPGAPTVDMELSDNAMTFENVTFGYIPGQKVLDNISFVVPRGKKVAIVGGSGSGKSTIVRLLFRFYDPLEGRILAAGQDTKDVDLTSLRNCIGIVPQDIVLFHNTIYYNLLYGNINATEEKVYEAARMADLHDQVLRMPNGYNTIVGERGLKLSGGEKQRVAIARAILKNPPFIIYDEATSSLDALTEQTIMDSLRRTIEKRTSLFIAHRLATIVDADHILVLENGKIAEEGDHVSLMENPDSRYAELWRSQHRIPDLKNNNKVNEKEAEFQKLLRELDMDKCCGMGGAACK